LQDVELAISSILKIETNKTGKLTSEENSSFIQLGKISELPQNIYFHPSKLLNLKSSQSNAQL
jgi:hypothetical protein